MVLEEQRQEDTKYKSAPSTRRYRLRHAIFDTFKNGQLCECGCGKEAKLGRRFIYGHNGKRDFLPFEEARKVVRSRGIKNMRSYHELYKQGKLPKGIPCHPDVTYKNKGWKNSADFLDNGFREYIPFKKAREEIHKLNIHSEDEYVRLHKEGRLPKGMPRYPSDLYRDKGWNGWYDFLGYKKFDWLSFKDAKRIIQKLEIPNGETFGILHREGKIPKGIPATPHEVYKGKGWNGWPNFLGNDKNIVYNTTRKFLSFKEARRIVRTLGIKSEKEYRRLGKQRKLPNGLPANPQLVYRKEDEYTKEAEHGGPDSWVDWADYLAIEDPDMSRQRIIRILRSLIGEIEQWKDNPTRLYTLLSANKMLNLRHNSHKQFIKDIIAAAQTKEGLQQIKDYLYSEDKKKEIPDLSPYTHGNSSIDGEIRTQTEIDLAESLGKQEFNGNGNDKDDLLVYNPIKKPEDLLESFNQINPKSISIDEENKEVLIVDCVNELWNSAYMHGIDRELVEVETGNEFRDEVAKRFLDDYNGCIKLGDNLPPGYSFPHPPRLMQLYVAHKVESTKGFLNLSGTGAGKTLSAVLASRVIDSKISVIICPNSVVKQWGDAIVGNKINHIFPVYPNSYIINDKEDAKQVKRDESKHQYIILNYDKFSRDDIIKLMRKLSKEKIDFIVLDELQFLKKRANIDESNRRENVGRLLTMARRNNDDLRVLGMTATPVINDLDEGKSLLEMVTGKRYDDLDTTPIIANGFATHQKLLLCSTRQIPEYKTGYGLHLINIDVEQPEDISIKSLKRNPMMLEQFLVRGKIPEILDCIDKEGHTLIYTEYVTGVVNQIVKAVRDAGYSCGLCIGENKSGLQPFKDGKLDVLVASHPAAVAVDGLQEVCSRLIISSLPWTNAQFQQLVGRIFREGQKEKVEIYVIRATITKMINGKMYRFPYDPVLKWDRIQSKKTMADCATDGILPTANLLSWKASRREAIKWIERLEKGEMSTVERRDFAVELPEDIGEIQEKERRIRKFGDISLMHQLWNREKSTTTHQRILEDPTFLLNYHEQLKEDEKKKSVIPRHIIANRIREMQRPRYMKRLIIADFGSGPAELSKLLPSNRVYSFDHSKVLGDSIIECDISHTSLKDNGIDVAVLSLSLMGRNWIDYIREARRVLTDLGHILIATTNRELDEHGTLYKEEKGRLYELRQILQREGFEINTDRSLGEFNFIYAMKR